MKTTRILILAGLTALSLGVGTAMAQSESNGYSGIPYWTLQRQADALRQAQARIGNQVQSGSSDVEQAKPGAIDHTLPFSPWDYGTLANPG
ncbi:MAG: hypothetical protein ABSA58_23320 [Acetobacteraceae bacterium]|jgi:hypothetical protein